MVNGRGAERHLAEDHRGARLLLDRREPGQLAGVPSDGPWNWPREGRCASLPDLLCGLVVDEPQAADRRAESRCVNTVLEGDTVLLVATARRLVVFVAVQAPSVGRHWPPATPPAPRRALVRGPNREHP